MRAARAPGQERAIGLTFEPFFLVAGFLLAIINRVAAALAANLGSFGAICFFALELLV
jgi:hypothetical protein